MAFTNRFAARWAAGLLALAVLGGCGGTSLASDVRSVRDLSGAPGLASVVEGEVDSTPGSDVRALLRAPLTVDTAVQVAVLNNRELRARLREIGVARGRLLQAGLVANPEIEIEKPPEPEVLLEVRVAYDITSLIVAPLQARAARADLEAVRYEVASSIVQLGVDVRAAYYAALAAEQQLRLGQHALDAFAASRDAAEALLEAGNIPRLDASVQSAAYQRERVELARLELETAKRREALSRLLGVHAADTAWTLGGELPDPPVALPAVSGLEKRALTRSFAIASTKHRLEAIAERTGLARVQGWIPEITVAGLSAYAENESEGALTSGPDRGWQFGAGMSLSVPLFDRRQGTTGALEAEFDALLERYHGLAVDLRSQVRELSAQLRSAHARARTYVETILPAQRQVMQETQLQYNAMQIGIFQLLQARRELLAVELSGVEARREYWVARAALDGVLAGAPATSVLAAGSAPSLGGGTAESEGGH